ncbi:hypothetical protein LXL04_028604 [Taraxacum kok-saghyz]
MLSDKRLPPPATASMVADLVGVYLGPIHFLSCQVSSLTVVIVFIIARLVRERLRSSLTYPKRYSIREVRGSRPIPGLVTSVAYTTKSALLIKFIYVRMLYAYLYIYYYTCALYILLGVMWSDLPKEILHKGGAGVEANTGACYQCGLHHLIRPNLPKGILLRELRGSGSIPGLVTSAAYTAKSALLFVVQADRSSKTLLSTTSHLGPFTLPHLFPTWFL